MCEQTDCQWMIERYENERAHIETVVSDRFNFFITFFGVIIAGAAATDSLGTRIIVVFIGAVICSMIATTIRRANARLDHALLWLEAQESHPAKKGKEFADRNCTISARELIGTKIPLFCAAVLWFAFVALVFIAIRKCS